jgi:superfamily II RNA helicase
MKEKKDIKKYDEEQQMYVINDLMREIIATHHYDKIIRKIIDELFYTGIDLLGVSSKNLAF